MGTYRIVVGVDGSEASQRALRWAAQEAAVRGGTLQAVTAWTWDGLEAPGVVATTPSEAQQWAERDMQDALREIRAAYPQLPLASEAVEGQPGKVLTDVARGSDLLVLGSHGHGRVFHAVLGSVSEECIRRASCPVVVVPTPHEARAPREDLVKAG